MSKKINLPVLPSMFDKTGARAGSTKTGKKPTLEAARARLGGTADGEPAPTGFFPGRLVSFGEDRLGVVLHASAAEVHVMLDALRVKRLPPSYVVLLDGPLPTTLDALATDAQVFGMLSAGQHVRYAACEGGELHVGKLIEKCRYGALVARADGTVLAVGFRKLWPQAISSEA